MQVNLLGWTLGDSQEAWLVNKWTGTPLTCWLDLRPLKITPYPQVNLSQSLVLRDSISSPCYLFVSISLCIWICVVMS
jgi:hypothetical protein